MMVRFGPNQIPTPRIKSVCEFILENFQDPINQVLLVAAIVSVIVGMIKDGVAGLIDGVSIFLALFIITAVNSANNYVSEKKLRQLVELSES
jgi:magnesium-transporting ATPase (P-type)